MDTYRTTEVKHEEQTEVAKGASNIESQNQPQATKQEGTNSVYHENKSEYKVTRTKTHADRKSTRLNSSHTVISYAVFCLIKQKKMSARLSHSTSLIRLALAEE